MRIALWPGWIGLIATFGCGDDVGGDRLCGNGTIDGAEVCDTGGESATCNADCTPASCGDGKLNAAAGEACDDGALVNSDAWAVAAHCNATCTGVGPHCGDGVRATSVELCDDGNTGTGDGCSATCEVEAGWHCGAGEPSPCVRSPGDDFVLLSPDTFTMGSPINELGAMPGEAAHSVTLSRPIWIQITEITQAQFAALMDGWNPSFFGPNGAGAECGVDCPVENVSWYDLLAYMNELSLSEGLAPCFELTNVECADATAAVPDDDTSDCMNPVQGGIAAATVALRDVTSVYDCTGYRLPTDAEWEYAARAGDARATYNGELTAATLNCEQPNATLDTIAWFCGNSGYATHPVAGLAANAWGLSDVLGNVAERCWDLYDSVLIGPVTDPEGPSAGDYRVFRGGNLSLQARYLRVASRGAGLPGGRDRGVGGRPVRTAP